MRNSKAYRAVGTLVCLIFTAFFMFPLAIMLVRSFSKGGPSNYVKVFDGCFSFQGKFFHFLAINRHREVEYNLLYPASVFSLFREHLNSLNKGFHKLFLFCFRCGMVDFIKCQ